MRVADIMTSPVVVIGPAASVSEAAQLMLGSHFSGLPVVTNDKRLVGMVTEGDFLRRSELGTVHKRPRWLEFIVSAGKQADEYVQTHGRRVEEVMTRDPATIEPGATLDELVELMSARRIKRVPVVTGGRLVGIVARSDLMRVMLRILPASASKTGDDEPIRQAIIDELAKQPWANAIRVKVDQGVVELSGAIFDERARGAARVAAENVAGVTQVIDELAWIEPVSGMYILPDRA